MPAVYPGSDDIYPDEDRIDSDDVREAHIHELARQLTRASTRQSNLKQNPFLDNDDPRLDPNSAKFDARTWLKTLVNLTSQDTERFPGRTAGVTFRNLHVHGFGSPTDYQKDVGNLPLGIFSSLKKMLGFKKGVHKIQILKEFDGIVKSGELLIVLGRPGR